MTTRRAFAHPDAGSRAEARLLRAAHPVVAGVVDRLVARRPVRRLPGLGLVVADPGAVRQVLSDSEAFVKHGPGSSGALWSPVLGDRVLLNMDGDEHRRLRRAVSDLFSPRVVGDVCERAVEPFVAQACATLRSGGEVDVVTLARQASAAAISVVVGLDGSAAESERLLGASDAIEAMVTWRTRRLDERQVAAARAHLSVVQDAAEASHASADDATVMGRLARLGTRPDEARSLAAALFLTGVGTVSSAVPRIVAQLGDAGLLAPPAASGMPLSSLPHAQPGGAPPAAGDLEALLLEGLRMTTPSLATLRRAVAAGEVAGVPVREGDRVVLLLWWATRRAGGFDPDRAVSADMRHLWFGAGSHFCLGAPLALAEMRSMVGGLVDVAADRGLRIVRRRAARRVLVPRYAELVVAVS